ncbi:MAG: alcohol dehydrogenase catalytic domain-containing protein [Anaerolineae bacterium]|jgi:threonine dehydrogenase-like Zn-dependent dehydrogenase|nr:alcohol dehydrogenase catalytic domain-containing protein [Anaerolineae bacterium]MDH7474779.1 alcohol dehydrogenase catalytic domain-containing protein [Anaerolineae bacterium]
MSDKLSEYRRADAPLPDSHCLWPLYGAGFENLGRDGQPVEVPMPQHGPDELLVRHDACGLCFSDVKVIQAGQKHPRIHRNMQTIPVVLGHEVTLTVVGVGDHLRGQYRIGDRFIVQADIYVGGVGYAYGYEIQGGLSQYSVIDQRVLNADHGNHLIPIQPGIGYAESALTEPWTCVATAYRLKYRTGLKPGGTTWIIGAPPSPICGGGAGGGGYTISAGFDEVSHPARLLLTNVPTEFAGWLRTRAKALGVEVIEVNDITAPPVERVDDIILLGADPELIEAVSPRLAPFGVLAIIADTPLPRKVAVDIGRVHYDRWLYVGGPGPDIARAYSDVPVRSELKPGGRAWFVGAGGPMGQMHVQRAIEAPAGPRTILCTARSDRRLRVVESIYRADAEAKGIAFTCVSRENEEMYRQTLNKACPERERRVGASGFDDIVVMAPDAEAIAEAADYLAPGGVMNIFAGVARGTMASLDLSGIYLKNVRFIGHSGLTTEDMRLTLSLVESGHLSPNRLVAAIGSLSAARDGLQAVKDAIFPGKIVIYPHIKDFPLTPLPDLKDKLPSVYAKLKDGREWTKEAEEEFLRLMLL